MIYIVSQAVANPLSTEVKGVYADKDQAIKHVKELDDAKGSDQNILNTWQAVEV